MRVEHDSLGEKEIPNDKYYGIQTLRACENFSITGIAMSSFPHLIKALATVKQAAAKSNHELGLLSNEQAVAIFAACKEVYAGKFDSHFPIDMIQGGAGTSANMNANEVITNRALELMGYKKGEYQHLHPNDHVNASQSTNDVYPTAAKIAIIWSSEQLIEALKQLRNGFLAKAQEFKDIIKMGRTQLQDAVPMTLGQEFQAFADTLDSELQELQNGFKHCYQINMGATAIGTGINTLPGYAQSVNKQLAEITKIELIEASNLIEATSSTSGFVAVSSALKGCAIKLTKICNDLRLLSSGPKAGLGDIQLPAMQPGSTIMPGKVNPVIPEVVNQICFQVIGFDLTITLAAQAGQMQLNAFEPIMLYDILEGIKLLSRGSILLQEKCINGITADKEHLEKVVYNSSGLATALAPFIGYEEAAKIAKLVQNSDRTVHDLLKDSKLLSKQQIDMILSPEFLTKPQPKLETEVKKKGEKH
ncbi:MAG: aspartate ammonia-lyase [Chlamydiia bacterium]